GGVIGYGLVDVGCSGDCGLAVIAGLAVGAISAAVGVGIVAVLVLRAMAEWQRGGKRARESRGSAAEAQATESLRVGDAGLTPCLLGPVPQELAEPVARLRQLAGVAEEGVDLALERLADVDPAVRLEGS